ncbi:MAG: hypothetical protein QM747_06605 [Nocardioides sp.]
MTAPAHARPVPCPREDGALTATPLPASTTLDIQSAFACTYRWTKVGHAEFAFVRTASTPLTPSVIAFLNTGFATHATPIADPSYDVGNQLQAIVATTPWGDHIYLSLLHGTLVRGPGPLPPSAPSNGWALTPSQRHTIFGP